MRKTKIVCTIGPACDNEDTLTQMCMAGMNVARLNFSHGTHEEHLEKIELIKQRARAAQSAHRHHARHQGPRVPHRHASRTASVMLNEGEHFTFTTEDVLGDRERVSVSYEGPRPGTGSRATRVLVNNGLMIFRVHRVYRYARSTAEVVAGGELSDRKSMSFPSKVLKQAYLSEQDKADMLLRRRKRRGLHRLLLRLPPQDLVDVHALSATSYGGEDIDVIAKIENRSGVDNIEEICEACDGIMIGRGDMGVEIPFEELPADPEEAHHQVPHAGQARHHRHGDARIA